VENKGEGKTVEKAKYCFSGKIVLKVRIADVYTVYRKEVVNEVNGLLYEYMPPDGFKRTFKQYLHLGLAFVNIFCKKCVPLISAIYQLIAFKFLLPYMLAEDDRLACKLYPRS
jgi:hypothetical protein